MGTDPRIQWNVANPYGIWMTSQGAWEAGHADYDMDQWNAGHMNDMLIFPDGSLVAAADAGGVWRINSAYGAFCLSDEWPHKGFSSLAFGPDGAEHIYAAGEALWMTDWSKPLPLLNWFQIQSLPKQVPNVGSIYRMAILPSRILVIASDAGILWAKIPAVPADIYVWQAAQVNYTGNTSPGFFGVARGPAIPNPKSSFADSVIAGGAGRNNPRGLFHGAWNTSGVLQLEPSQVFSPPGVPADALISQTSWISVASCDRDPAVAYAFCSDDQPDPQPAGIFRSADGGATWTTCGFKLEGSNKKRTGVFEHQGAYTNCVAVSPADSDVVSFGMTRRYISVNQGATWFVPGYDLTTSDNALDDAHLHVDVHGIRFPAPGPYAGISPVAQQLYEATDGGIAAVQWGMGGWLIQSDFFDDNIHGNLELVVLESNSLVHYERHSNDPTGAWQRVGSVTDRATGRGSIIRSDYVDSEHEHFELVVLEGTDLVHYWRDHTVPGGAWNRGLTVTGSASSPGCLIQSSFGGGAHGNFEVVVLEGNNLNHYWHDNSNPTSPWQFGATISTEATGEACMIESSYSGWYGNFELVVLEGNNLVHYWRDNAAAGLPWHRGVTITSDATGPACLFQSDYGVAGTPANFELFVQEGPVIGHWFRDNSDPNLPWIRITSVLAAGDKASGPACVIQGDYGAGAHGNFELIVPEGGNLIHYWRDNTQSSTPWLKGVTVTHAAFNFKSRYNQNLATLECFRQSDPVTKTYGTLGVCAPLPSVVVCGLKDNGTVGCDSGSTPWFSIQGGDAAAACFPGVPPLAIVQATGRVLVSYSNDTSAPTSFYWDASQRQFAAYPQQPSGSGVIPLRNLKPGTPVDPTKGLLTPRMEAVTVPSYWLPNQYAGAVAAQGADVWGLFIGNTPDPDLPQPPMVWDYLGTVTGLDTTVSDPIRAIASVDGSSIFLGTDDGQLLLMNAATGKTQVIAGAPVPPRFRSIRGLTASPAVATAGEFWAIVEATDLLKGGPEVLHWDGKTLKALAALPAGTRSLVAIAIDPTTAPVTVFVASENQVLTTLDGGVTWLDASQGLPKTFAASDLRWTDDGNGARLYLSTFGRSVWVAMKRTNW